MAVSVLIIACLVGTVASLQPAQNVTKSCLNLDLELHWDTPSDATSDTLYTVAGCFNNEWKDIPACTDISETRCINMTSALVALFGQRKVRGSLDGWIEARVSRHEGSRRTNASAQNASVRFEVYMEATISAPEIIEELATANSVLVTLVGPSTPFTKGKTREPVRMNSGLKGVSAVYYNYTLCPVPAPPAGARSSHSCTNQGSLSDASKDSSRLSLDELQPNTRYSLAVQSRIGLSVYSRDTAQIYLRTEEAAPSQGPDLLPPHCLQIDCDEPNSRDVLIRWKPPPRASWNGDQLAFEVRYTKIGPEGHHVAVPVGQANSTTLYGLSRWDRYDIVVLANTTAGGTPSVQKYLPKTVVGMAKSSPPNLTVLENTSNSTTIVTWERDAAYGECIYGYLVKLRPHSGVAGAREQTVRNSLVAEFVDLKAGAYTVEVVPLVVTGFGERSQGVAGTIRLDVGTSTGQRMLIVVIIFAVMTCIVFFLAFFKIKHCLNDDKFTHLNVTKIQNRASSKELSPSRQQFTEREFFDSVFLPPTVDRANRTPPLPPRELLTGPDPCPPFRHGDVSPCTPPAEGPRMAAGSRVGDGAPDEAIDPLQLPDFLRLPQWSAGRAFGKTPAAETNHQATCLVGGPGDGAVDSARDAVAAASSVRAAQPPWDARADKLSQPVKVSRILIEEQNQTSPYLRMDQAGVLGYTVLANSAFNPVAASAFQQTKPDPQYR